MILICGMLSISEQMKGTFFLKLNLISLDLMVLKIKLLSYIT